MKYEVPIYVLAFVSAIFANTQPKSAATLIITNAAIYTVDKQLPKAQAMAAIGDRIVAVGSNTEIDSWRGPQTQVIDGGGKLVLPGFNDAHVHFIQGGAQLDQVELTDATSPQEFAKRIAAQISKTPRGEWILGCRWDETKWSWGSTYLRLGAVKGYEAYTIGSAFAEFQEKDKGSITPGKLADIVILNNNIFDLKPEAIRNIKVETTIVGGKIVYSGKH